MNQPETAQRPEAPPPPPHSPPPAALTETPPSAPGIALAQSSQAPPDPQTLRRRKFLNWLCIGLGSVSLASIFWAVVGFMLSPLAKEGEGQWRPVGKVEDFKVGDTTIVKFTDSSTVPWAGYAGKTAAWLRRDGESAFTCFSVNCTHLGCPVRWIDTAQLFMCPCHGGVYYQDGAVAAGPPPDPLPRYPVRVRDGNVEILASGVPITRGVS